MIQEPIPIGEAIVSTGLDYLIHKVPLTYVWPPNETDPDKITVMQSDKVSLVRPPLDDETEPRELGQASSGFEVVQNHELGELLGPLNESWPIETVGALKEGAITFLTLDMGQLDVGGEEVGKYLLVSNGHDGTRGLSFKAVRTRVVCANTLEAAEGERSAFDFTLRHTQGIREDAKWILDLMGRLRTQEEKIDETMQRMAEVQLDDEGLNTLIDAAYPLPKQPAKLQIANEAASEAVTADQVKAALELREHAANNNTEFERKLERAETIRAGMREAYEGINESYPQIAGTVWAGVNGITEVSNWRNGRNADSSVIFGDRAGEGRRAYVAARKLVTA